MSLSNQLYFRHVIVRPFTSLSLGHDSTAAHIGLATCLRSCVLCYSPVRCWFRRRPVARRSRCSRKDSCTRTTSIPTVICMTGLIERGDAVALRHTLEQVKRKVTRASDGTLVIVELSSYGGDVFEGVAI